MHACLRIYTRLWSSFPYDSIHLSRHRREHYVHSAGVMASALRNETPEQRAERKERVKQQKADKRARREGHIPDDYGQKACTLCHQPKDLLIRCQIDKTEAWHMVCGKCWRSVSGGVVDGDDSHPHYRYGGLWKNLHKKDKQPGSPNKGDLCTDDLQQLEIHNADEQSS